MGKKRRELVIRVGYDSKKAVHLIRLLRMGIEFLTEGTMYVERADGPELTRNQARSLAAGKSESRSREIISTGAGGLCPFTSSP